MSTNIINQIIFAILVAFVVILAWSAPTGHCDDLPTRSAIESCVAADPE